MSTVGSFLSIYLFGGITFIPLVICLVLCHAYFLLPIRDPEALQDEAPKPSHTILEKSDTLRQQLGNLPPGVQLRTRESDVAAGYFAVCREFVAGGVNGKPPERTTPAGAVVPVESPSVYQNMYRSIFDRGKVQGPSIEAGNAGGARTIKRGRNVFYVVLRLGHLMLYDDTEQLEVRHVLSLSLYDIDIYAGGELVPEGELWVKRNCIRLTWRETKDVSHDSKPFYFFSDNCSDKEDFYHAMLQNQDRIPGYATPAPVPLDFDSSHMVKLVQQLHASEETMQTRWVNALMGRLFLSLYKTSDLQNLVHKKIAKKVARVPKPAFIESIKVKQIDLGDSAPLMTNPKLKELTLDGDMTVECDISYKGNLRLEIAAVARIDLGPRFKARRVDLLLAGLCKSLQGHLLIRVKPPPSNRIWFSFEAMPKLDLSIEPIVSSRQITYSIILRAIESRIREVIGDTLVLPNWDDISFSDTTGYSTRGGIWAEQALTPSSKVDNGSEENLGEDEHTGDVESDIEHPLHIIPDKAMSTPTLLGRRRTSATSYPNVSLDTRNDTTTAGISSAINIHPDSGKPPTMRSNSFATAASPVMSMDPAIVQAVKDYTEIGRNNATQAMQGIARSQPSSPLDSPVGSPSDQPIIIPMDQSSASSLHASSDLETFDGLTSPSRESVSTSSLNSVPGHGDPRLESKSSISSSSLKRQSITTNAVIATVAAKKWGLDLVARHSASSQPATGSTDVEHPLHSPSQDSPSFNPTTRAKTSLDNGQQPIGRGLPLPPPGTPLPGPAKQSWTAALSGLAKRKPITNLAGRGSSIPQTSSGPSTPPPLPRRPNKVASASALPKLSPSLSSDVPATSLSGKKVMRQTSVDGGTKDDVLVIKAPKNDADIPSSEYSSVGDTSSTDVVIGKVDDNGDQVTQDGMCTADETLGLEADSKVLAVPGQEVDPSTSLGVSDLLRSSTL